MLPENSRKSFRVGCAIVSLFSWDTAEVAAKKKFDIARYVNI